MENKRSQPNVAYMFRQACAFVDCAEACEREPNHIKVRTASHFLADMTNSCLACEIFIKMLLVNKGCLLNKIHGHELYVLWNKYAKVDVGSSTDIRDRVNGVFQSEEDVFSSLLKKSFKLFLGVAICI